MRKLAKGDTVLLGHRRGFSTEKAEVTIAKVGRKYAYVDSPWFNKVPFDLEDGCQAGNYIGYGARIYTPEGWPSEQRRGQLFERLRKHTQNPAWENRLSDDTLEKLLAVLDEAADQ